MEHLPYEGMLRAGAVQPQERKAPGDVNGLVPRCDVSWRHTALLLCSCVLA